MSDESTHPLPPLPPGFDRNSVEALSKLAWKLIDARRHPEAIACLQEVTQLAPAFVEAWANLSSLLLFGGKAEQAVTCYRQAVGLEPANLDLRKALVRALRKANQRAVALSECDVAIQHGADDTEIHLQRGNLLQELGRFGEAVEHIQRAIALAGRLPPMLNDLGIAQLRGGQIEAAMSSFSEAISKQPDFADAHYNLGTALLLQGDYARGLPAYAWRRGENGRPQNTAILAGNIPRWTGQALAGKRVMLCSEQGVGDIIMFMSLLPAFLKETSKLKESAGLGLVTTPRMKPFIDRDFPALVGIYDTAAERPACQPYDYHLPLGDLMNCVLPHYTPADHPPYLTADVKRSNRLREQYLGYAHERGRTKLIGVSWHTTNPRVGPTRNIALSEFHPLFSLAGIQFVSLQYGDHAEEIAECNRRVGDILYHDSAIDAFNDLDGLAAQMSAMDQIVTIDNSTVHLAGALGRPTTLLLSAAPDWRWGLNGSGCRWYRSVCLERQETIFDWRPVIERVRSRLSANGA